MAELNLSRYRSIDDITPTKCIEDIIIMEGGYVNDPTDMGGETNYGITKRTALKNKDLWAKHNFNGDMKVLPKALAYDIYYREYWKKSGCEFLMNYSRLLAFQVFDVAVNMGPGRAIGFLQTSLNVSNRGEMDYGDQKIDMAWGPTMQSTIERFYKRNGVHGMNNLLYQHCAQQLMFYMNLAINKPNQEKFMNGWSNRVTAKLNFYGDLID